MGWEAVPAWRDHLHCIGTKNLDFLLHGQFGIHHPAKLLTGIPHRQVAAIQHPTGSHLTDQIFDDPAGYASEGDLGKNIRVPLPDWVREYPDEAAVENLRPRIVISAERFGCIDPTAPVNVAVSPIPGRPPVQLAPVLKSVPTLFQTGAAPNEVSAVKLSNPPVIAAKIFFVFIGVLFLSRRTFSLVAVDVNHFNYLLIMKIQQ